MADEDDPGFAFKALFDAGEDVAAELAEMSERGRVRRLRQIIRDYKPGKTEPKAEAKEQPRDPSTGQFKKTSQAPEPITPVASGSAGSRSPLDARSDDEFIAMRNEERRNSGSRLGLNW